MQSNYFEIKNIRSILLKKKKKYKNKIYIDIIVAKFNVFYVDF